MSFLLALGFFGRVPQGVHFLERRLARLLASEGERTLDRRETPLEFLVGRAQHRFGIRLHVTGEIDDGEQQVADFAADGISIVFVERSLDLIRLLANFTQDSARVVPIETDLAGLRLKF